MRGAGWYHDLITREATIRRRRGIDIRFDPISAYVAPLRSGCLPDSQRNWQLRRQSNELIGGCNTRFIFT